MVAGLSRKKKSQAALVDRLSSELDALRKTGDALLADIDRDARAYDEVMKAYKLPQSNGEEIKARNQEIQRATRDAAEVPLEVAGRAVALFEQLGQLQGIAAASMRSDLQVARWMAAAAVRGALANVEINLDGITDSTYVETLRTKLAGIREKLAVTPIESLSI
jgi:methenyltetrahydrofolate cyclohydrolase